MARLLAAADMAALQEALPACLARALEAEAVLLVAPDEGGLSALAGHGDALEQRLYEGREAIAMALELMKPVSFDPETSPDQTWCSLVAPLKLEGRALAIACQRPTPFDVDALEALQELVAAVEAQAVRLRGNGQNRQAAAFEARMRHQERRLNELSERLHRNEKLKSDFVATMSHELRTPLNVVLGFTSLLADHAFGELSKEQDEVCGKILESSERLVVLINDLLDVSKLEAGTLQFNFAPLDLNHLLVESVEDVRPLAEQRGLTLEVGTLPGDHQVEADVERLRHVLAHLLDNAVKFTEPGGRVGVRLLDEPAEPNVAIEVWDTGIGIPENARHRLFERFYQVDNSSTRLYGGTGLGLALVKEFVERHGGHVQLESEPGQGSTFRLVLPRESANRRSAMILD